MRRVSSAGCLSEETHLRGTPPLSSLRTAKHSSQPNLAALDLSSSKPPRPVAPTLDAACPGGTRSAVCCKAFLLDHASLQDVGALFTSDVQLEAALHVPAGQAEQCLVDARRTHEVTHKRSHSSINLSAPALRWEEAEHGSTVPNSISAEWILGSHTEDLDQNEVSTLAACLAAPPSEVPERSDSKGENEARAEQTRATQRANASVNASRAMSADAMRLASQEASQELSQASDRFSLWIARIRRKQHKERIARLKAAMSSLIVPNTDGQGKGSEGVRGGEDRSSVSIPGPVGGSPFSRQALHVALQPVRALSQQIKM